MVMASRTCRVTILLAAVTLFLPATRVAADEPAAWNKLLAEKYMDARAQKWFDFSGADRGEGPDKVSCVSCHSVLPYALARPVLRKLTGKTEPGPLETRLLEQTAKRALHWDELDSKRFRLFYDFSDQKKKESWGTEAVLNAVILAFDDRYQGRNEAGAATRKALANLWRVQQTGADLGSFEWLDFGMEPWEAKESRYFGAALAALAVGAAPRYYTPGADADLDKKVELLRGYLRGKRAKQNLNNRVWLLWAAAMLDGLLTQEEQRTLTQAIFEKQRDDGGWGLSSLGMVPRKGVDDAGSDGYATGLVLHVLQTAGTAKGDARLAKGLTWLRSHQAPTGQWLAQSVNKKRDPDSHAGKFMSDAATAFAVLALSHEDSVVTGKRKSPER
jgi:squalene-hopene/tetraprenyl-beta-curcumene cyclase